MLPAQLEAAAAAAAAALGTASAAPACASAPSSPAPSPSSASSWLLAAGCPHILAVDLSPGLVPPLRRLHQRGEGAEWLLVVSTFLSSPVPETQTRQVGSSVHNQAAVS